MAPKSSSLPWDLVQTQPGLSLLRLAALIADEEGELDEDALDAMFEQVEVGELIDAPPPDIWVELMRGLMARFPAKMIMALRACGALKEVLPEVSGLFGVPQIADEPAEVDLGEHLLNSLTEAARYDAPLAVRFALLVMNIGKTDSPREHLPVHYRHIERGRPRIEAISDRFCVPDECRELALLALAECERVHRVSEMRAGPIALMLDRLQAFDRPALFQSLMTVCTCDYLAYGNRSGKPYPKAALLDKALLACADLGEDKQDELETARAMAIAQVFRSERWSEAE